MRILGLDISSSCIGIAVIEHNDGYDKPQLIHLSYHNPYKSNDIIERLKKTQMAISEILNEYKPDEIAVEQIVQFLGGGSSANTIITLARFNAAVSLQCYDFLGKSPTFYSVLAIRHGLKFGKKLPEKEAMPNIVAKHLGIKFHYVYSGKGKKRKKKPANLDMADGLAVALHHYYQLKKEKDGSE